MFPVIFLFNMEDRESVPYFPFSLVMESDVWVLHNPLLGIEEELNQAAYFVLKLCDGYRTLEEVATELSGAYGESEDVILRRIEPMLSRYTDEGLLWWRSRRMTWWKLQPPMAVLWDLTSGCNLKCRHCVVSAGPSCHDELGLEDCKRLIDEMSAFGVSQLIMSGGEPMLRPDFFDIAGYATSKNLSLQVATNGTLIDEDAARELSRIGAFAQVSLDASGPEIHDYFRQVSGSWDRTIEGIRLLVKEKVPVTLASVVTSCNVDDIPKLYELAANLGVQTFRILPFVPAGRGDSIRDLEISPAKMKELTGYLLDKKEEVGLDIAPMEFACTFSPPPEGMTDTDTRLGCDGGVAYCTITSKGEVLPCNYFAGAEAENVKEKDFEWIWHNSRFLNYFRSLVVSDLHGACGECSWLSVCRGSCVAANFSHGDIFQSNCHCWLVHPEN